MHISTSFWSGKPILIAHPVESFVAGLSKRAIVGSRMLEVGISGDAKRCADVLGAGGADSKVGDGVDVVCVEAEDATVPLTEHVEVEGRVEACENPTGVAALAEGLMWKSFQNVKELRDSIAVSESTFTRNAVGVLGAGVPSVAVVNSRNGVGLEVDVALEFVADVQVEFGDVDVYDFRSGVDVSVFDGLVDAGDEAGGFGIDVDDVIFSHVVFLTAVVVLQ